MFALVVVPRGRRTDGTFEADDVRAHVAFIPAAMDFRIDVLVAQVIDPF